MEGMPAGLRRIASQAAQLLTSHVCFFPLTALVQSGIAVGFHMQRPCTILNVYTLHITA